MTPGGTSAETPAAQPSRRPLRRFFSDTEKRALAIESDQPGISVSSVARKHGIVTGLLFRWRVQFDIAQRQRAMLAPVVLPAGVPVMLALQDLLGAPDATAAVTPADGLHTPDRPGTPGRATDDDRATPL